MIKDSGERTEFGTGAVRDMHSGKGRMDLLPWEALIEVSKHCEEGALKYGERNCEKGIPIHSLIDSAFRHLAKYMMGMKDEPHLRAAAWNILFALYMEIKHPELQDIPTRLENSSDCKYASVICIGNLDTGCCCRSMYDLSAADVKTNVTTVAYNISRLCLR